ncbi:MAG: hypothetical protein FJX74_05170 [Armatimonadetes bacterium]|nr:hypothetical protein [Armatimonadota bacterium]
MARAGGCKRQAGAWEGASSVQSGPCGPSCSLPDAGEALRAAVKRGGRLQGCTGHPCAHGFGSTIAQRYESYGKHYEWRGEVATWLSGFGPHEPIYLEAALARRWFSSDTAARLDQLARVRTGKARPFVEVLLRRAAASKAPAAVRGTCFEAAAGLLLSSTPGFGVHEARSASHEQVDLVVRYQPEHLGPVGLDPGPGLVECKSSTEPVTSRELRNFAAKCLLHRTKFGILFARASITGRKKFDEPEAAELVRRRFQVDGLLVLVITVKDMEGKWYEMRGLAEPLAEDLRELVFGPKG